MFFLSFFLLLSSFPRSITQKVYSVYKQSTHQTDALLSEIFLFLVRAVCKLSCVTKAFLYAILCIITCTTKKLKVVQGRFTYRTIGLVSEISILFVSAVCEIASASYGFKHASPATFDATFWAYVLTLVTRELQVVRGRFTHRTTALLSEMYIFRVRAGFEMQIASCASKHSSQSFPDRPFYVYAVFLDA